MGNNDFYSMGRNKVEEFKGGFFSFAYGDEIALVLDDENSLYGKAYYILNCDDDLWFEVKNEIIKTKGDKKKLIKFWIKKSKKYEISGWSDDFTELRRKKWF